jgi:nicotinate-nucleotide adenylyltransferase
LRVGLLGGSFNPAHGGHRHISVTALKRLKLDAVWWLVSPQNPLKASAGMAPLSARLARAEQVAAHPRIHISAVETALGTRYTVDTVRALCRRFRQTRFIWLMGADNLAGFHRWKQWRTIARTVPIAVLLRPGYTEARWNAPAALWFRPHRVGSASASRVPNRRPPALVIVTLPMDATSATALRAADPAWASRRVPAVPSPALTP